jgi:hypothetical protein
MMEKKKNFVLSSIIGLTFTIFLLSCGGSPKVDPTKPAVESSLQPLLVEEKTITLSITPISPKIMEESSRTKTANPTKEPFPTTSSTILPSSTAVVKDLQETISPTPYLCEVEQEPFFTELEVTKNGKNLSGKFSLCYLHTISAFDLDKGLLVDNGISSGDIQITMGHAEIDNQDFHYINEINGARVDQAEIKSPDLEYCKELLAKQDDGWFFIEGEVGFSGCVLTNEGRIAAIQVERINPYGWGSIELSFTTVLKIARILGFEGEPRLMLTWDQ